MTILKNSEFETMKVFEFENSSGTRLNLMTRPDQNIIRINSPIRPTFNIPLTQPTDNRTLTQPTENSPLTRPTDFEILTRPTDF